MSVDHKEAQDSHINKTLSNDDYFIYFISHTCGAWAIFQFDQLSRGSHFQSGISCLTPTKNPFQWVIKTNYCVTIALTARLLLNLIYGIQLMMKLASIYRIRCQSKMTSQLKLECILPQKTSHYTNPVVVHTPANGIS